MPCSSDKKIELLKDHIDNDIFDSSIDKNDLLECWILIYKSEEKNNQKVNIWLNGENAKNVLVKLMLDCLIEIDDRHKYLVH